jgi:hypothetical protein
MPILGYFDAEIRAMFAKMERPTTRAIWALSGLTSFVLALGDVLVSRHMTT